MTQIITTDSNDGANGVFSNISEHIYIAEGVTRITTGLSAAGLAAIAGGSVINVLGSLVGLFNVGMILTDTGDSSGADLVNYGLIQSLGGAGFVGVNFFDNDTGNAVSFTNYGTVAAAGSVAVLGDLNDVDKVWNFGTLNGGVLQGGGSDFFRNGGHVAGDIDLGGGSDRFKGWGGTVEGTINGGAGNDTIAGVFPTTTSSEAAAMIC